LIDFRNMNTRLRSKGSYFPWPILVLRASAARSASKCPLLATFVHVSLSQGQFFSLAHFNISKCPPSTAKEHVSSFQGQLFSLAHFNISKYPFLAANVHVHLSQG
jgi:hypothetical protein